ncbi:type IV toxin-antitoxin system AbiEi family antitoxin domain-containing protein [Phycicoccus duodecadis]|uniref:AbiEi antitoxin N-terminal domain-containing protein n=1 Tax=Phycicoccus duodecadis TaxID=173053 RepID=A0A2N3YKF6_9MICO|nr:type IV toxin-antitoxin system AbiEi family antitoxin domain-containing protein [Phycicoccus duodecadis]PKW27322.1 hypothetical protein ATL31_2161 [Phycicoccus duodecadis]
MTTTTTARPSLDPTTLDLARGQAGALTTRQLLEAGHSEGALLELVAGGALAHPGRGLYLVPSLVGSQPLDRLRALAVGSFLLYPDAVLGGETALAAHGVTVWGSPMTRPTLFRPVRRAGGMAAVWVRPARGTAVDTPWGPATPVADALAQHAVDHGLTPGVVSADMALHTSAVTTAEVRAAVGVVSGHRHGSRAVAMLQHLDGARESVGESRTALAMALGGLDAEAQVVIHDTAGRFVARADFRVRGTKVLVEFDGRVKYASGDPAVLWEEKKREDRLRRLGYVVVRVTWADLERPGAVAAAVWRAVRGR